MRGRSLLRKGWQEQFQNAGYYKLKVRLWGKLTVGPQKKTEYIHFWCGGGGNSAKDSRYVFELFKRCHFDLFSVLAKYGDAQSSHTVWAPELLAEQI